MIVDVEQGSEEWLRARAGKLTASRIADVMAQGKGGAPSITRSKYLGEIVAERMTGEPARMSFRSASMEHGNETEAQARAVYMLKTGLIAEQVGLIVHDDYPNFAASPDALVGKDGGLEIKCPDTHTHLATMLDPKVPAQYRKQIQWNMACTDRAWWDFMSFEPSLPDHLRSIIIRTERNEEMIETMIDAALAFDADAEAMIARLNDLYTPEQAA